MNYFDLFEISVQLNVNTAGLSRRFFELSKKYHPDYFIGEQQAAQAEALEMSAMLNKAWKTFQSHDETIKYVLQLKQLLQEEEKYTLPPDFLMEVLEINEQLMDDNETENIDAKIQQLTHEIYEPVKEIVEHYKEGTTTEKELLQVKEYYYKKKYLDRISRELAAK